jgi:hypothetical protein
MAKANLVLPGGTKVAIEGTADEVAGLLERFSDGAAAESSNPAIGTRRRKLKSSKAKIKTGKAKSPGPTDFIRELIADGYFKSEREIGDVRDKLKERAHIYAVTSISGPLVRLVRKKELRRSKKDGVWKYANW